MTRSTVIYNQMPNNSVWQVEFNLIMLIGSSEFVNIRHALIWIRTTELLLSSYYHYYLIQRHDFTHAVFKTITIMVSWWGTDFAATLWHISAVPCNKAPTDAVTILSIIDETMAASDASRCDTGGTFWRHVVYTNSFISCCCKLWPLLLTWFNFNPSMDK